MRRKRNNRRGFTILELMVASSILVMIGLAVLTAFGSGFHVYERVQSYGGVQTDVLLALEDMERQLRNTFFSSEISFSGDLQSVRFPAIVERTEKIGEEERDIPSVGQIAYYLSEDEGGRNLIREQRNYSEAISEGLLKKDRKEVVVAVTEMKFSYYVFDVEEGKYLWKTSWLAEKDEEGKGPPAGVKIEITFDDGGREIPLTRTMMIPSVHIVDTLVGAGEEEAEEEGDAGEV